MDIKSTALLLFLAMDSPGNLSVFSAALRHLEPKRRWQVILREMLFALLILLLFLFAGEPLLKGLGLRLETLSIAGGLILFLISLRMIFPQPNGALGLVSNEEPFLVPLAIPLIAGPSAVALILRQAACYPQQLPSVILAVVLAWVASLVVLLSGTFCVRWLGKKGLSTVERLMGLILLLVSIQMMLEGFRSYMPLLQG
ncbi:YhgN family NAAT transporter [unidentified bacterial endosymbiont]|uniref:YhgN family NAAT transporter n=1 Tax=unidentified bacterial endosymbiont TaxID=2355 RepID=UPI0026467368|nr:YhgN family NAAT transporter [unidentified bacterial endosymbiont]